MVIRTLAYSIESVYGFEFGFDGTEVRDGGFERRRGWSASRFGEGRSLFVRKLLSSSALVAAEAPWKGFPLVEVLLGV